MNNILSGERIREVESININEYGISSDMLMEKAGFLAARHIIERFPAKNTNILIVCGNGNNGADGLVIARELARKSYNVYVLIKKGSMKPMLEKQYDIIERLNTAFDNVVSFIEFDDIKDNYSVCVDCLYGTGINRDLNIDDVLLINKLNTINAYKIALDIPSGLNATTGEIYNVCFNADETITLGAYKTGLFIKEGPNVCGKVYLENIGLWLEYSKSDYILFNADSLSLFDIFIKNTANKSTYGKTLVIAGSDKIYGATYLSAKAALKAGAGMVKVFTHEANRDILCKELPECLMSIYNDTIDDNVLINDIRWGDTIVIGPGLSTDERAVEIVSLTLEKVNKGVIVLDADAINIVAKHKNLFDILAEKAKNKTIQCVLTPHKKELSRLRNLFDSDLQEEDFCRFLFNNYGIYVVNKDANTRIYGEDSFINVTGNEGMATAGSGDVLSGIMGGLINRINNASFSQKVAVCVCIHGLCGDIYAMESNSISMTANDLINTLPKALEFLTLKESK